MRELAYYVLLAAAGVALALGGALGYAAASDAVGNVFTSGKAKTALGNPTAVVRKLAAP